MSTKPQKRIAEIHRKTKETDIKVVLNLDGSGQSQVSTGLPFLDHMLDLFARHGLFDLEVVCRGDLEAYKAWSQNLGHESMVTTLGCYGAVSPRRQADIIRSLSIRPPSEDRSADIERLLETALAVTRKNGLRT